MRTVVLVEGVSDQRALEELAARRGRDLDADGVSIVPMGGAHALGRFLERYGPGGLDLRLAGLCDAGEEADFKRALERAGFGSDLTREGMEALGFYVCVVSLEDELIRAVGADGVERVIAAEGELGSFAHVSEAAGQARADLRAAAPRVHVEPKASLRNPARPRARPRQGAEAAGPATG